MLHRARRTASRARAAVLRQEPPSLVEGGIAFTIAFVITYIAQLI